MNAEDRFPEGTIILQTSLSAQVPHTQLHLHVLDAGRNTLLDVTLTADEAFRLISGGLVRTVDLANRS